jgi:hypothetical protein
MSFSAVRTLKHTVLQKSDLIDLAKARSIDSPTLDIHSVDPVPPKSVEKIGLLLMDGTADEKTLNLCKVIIHFKAAAVLYASHLQGPKTPDVQKHIRQMEYHHMTAALTAMDGISFLTPPSILLVQALIIGVCVTILVIHMQYTNDHRA